MPREPADWPRAEPTRLKARRLGRSWVEVVPVEVLRVEVVVEPGEHSLVTFIVAITRNRVLSSAQGQRGNTDMSVLLR